jgi:two-component sensor histidine kinase/streptogramin lyase
VAFTLYKTGNNTGVYSIYEDESGVFWVGTGDGLNKFDRNKEVFTLYKKDCRDSGSLSDNFILSIFGDTSGVMWIGTRSGLNKLNPKIKKFNLFRHNPSSANSLSHNYVWSIIEDRYGTLWIGTDDGINKYDRGKNLFTCYKNEPGNPGSLSHNCVYSINEDHSGNIWIGTANGLDKFNREGEFFTHYKRNTGSSTSLSSNVIMRIFTDKTGLLWVGTYRGGLNKFDPNKGIFTHYKNDPRNSGTISSNTITSIYEDLSGVLWIGTNGGLNKFDREQEIFTSYKNDPRNSRSLDNNKIESIYEDRSGVMWLGTYGGLSRFDREKEVFTYYTGKYGLPQVIYGILEDDHSNLWLSSNKGIFKFNPAAGTVKSYAVSDGLQDYHFNSGAYFKSNTGEMFLGGANGFNAFYPDDIKDNPFIPPVVITSFKVFYRDYKLEKNILQTRAIWLSYNDTFSFEFAALCFSDPGKNKYAYKLTGASSDWIDLGNKREITFSNLSPGEYTLKVKGSNADGVWNEKGKELTITIIPPFWETWWFRIPGFLLFVLYIFLKIRNVRKKNKRLELFNTKLKKQILEREQAEDALQKTYAELEVRIKKRTSELTNVNVQLKKEITERERTNEDMQKEIGERKKMEEKINESLKEKEVLLKEIHHRVKNNLQVISSLLSLQSRHIKEKQTIETLKDCQDRIRAMALIHEELYRSEDFSKIDFRKYITNLIKNLFISYSLRPGQVQLKIEIEDIFLDLGAAIPLGLIINELTSNSLEHAFPDDRKGELCIKLGKNKCEEEEYNYILIVSDDGIGFPGEVDFRESGTLGMLLVNALTKQLRGSLDLDNKDGTTFTIKFKKSCKG